MSDQAEPGARALAGPSRAHRPGRHAALPRDRGTAQGGTVADRRRRRHHGLAGADRRSVQGLRPDRLRQFRGLGGAAAAPGYRSGSGAAFERPTAAARSASAMHVDGRGAAGPGDRAQPRGPRAVLQCAGARPVRLAARRQPHLLGDPHAGISRRGARRARARARRHGHLCRARSGRPAHGGDGRPAGARQRARRQHPRAAARSDRGRAHQPDARRFHRQCEPRAPHAARLAARLHRDAAKHRQGRSRRARALPADHGRAGLAHDAADRCAAVA